MSKLNILRIIKNLTNKTTIYTPIIEAIVNSIEAIDKKENGKIEIIAKRELVLEFDNAKPPIIGFEIVDNGIGFNSRNRDSFDTFFSEEKKSLGGKGFGRFMYLKYFNEVKIESVFIENSTFELRKFRFGKEEEIIVNEHIQPTKQKHTGTRLFLDGILDDKQIDKGIEVIARKIVEKLLVYFANDEYNVPQIILREKDNTERVVLNDFINNENAISLVGNKNFTLQNKQSTKDEKFKVKVYKIYYSTSNSKISLTAHNREVTETAIHNYIPEFQDDFYDIKNNTNRNYIIKAYVSGEYLNEHVSFERGSFNFPKDEPDEFFVFSQYNIEKEAANAVKSFFETEVNIRFEKKRESVSNYIINNAPWHRTLLKEFDISGLPYNPTPEKIEIEFQRYKFNREVSIRTEVKAIIAEDQFEEQERLQKIISQITENGRNDLAHYVCNRKLVIETFDSLRRRRGDESAHLESEIHNLIFPMGSTNLTLNYENHNLWLLDERLVFSQYVASDKRISSEEKGEPDLVVFYDEKCAYRNGENEITSPLSLFEFKRPKRTNYTDADNPIIQACRYVDKIRLGKYEMPEGIEPIKINEYTPVYIYIGSAEK